jgi:ribose transport system substrate-binding protein
MTPRRTARVALTLVATVAIGAFALAGCSSDSASGGDSSGTKKITMVTPANTDPFYGAMYCGAKAAAKKEKVDLTIQGTPEITVEAEMAVVQTVLATNPDGMLLTVWDQTAFNNVMKDYTSAGHPLVMPDSYLGDKDYLQSIRTDSYQSSYDAALQVVKDKGLTSGKVLIVTDSPGNAIQSARAQGFKDAIDKETKLKTLELAYVGNDSAKASAAVTSAAAGNSDLALVFSTNIGAGTGSANGIATSGAKIVHVGYDTSAEQVEQLKKGQYDVLIAQSPYTMGFEGVTLVAQVLKGEKKASSVKPKDNFTKSALVTAANADTPEMKQYIYSSDCSQAG